MLALKLNIVSCLVMIALATGLVAYEFPQKKSSFVQEVESQHQETVHSNFLIDLSERVSGIVQTAEKALVFVTVTYVVQSKSRVPDLFEHFFGGPRRPYPHGEQLEKRTSYASGFFVDLDNGYIVTNAHVVKDSKNIILTLANGEEYEGVVTGADSNTDIAVLQVADPDFSRAGLDWLQLTDSTKLRTGDFVVALGAPFGFKASVSFGIVSGLRRGNLGGLTALGNFIQTDAAINPGNSGGPLLDARGQVIGVNSAIYTVSGGYNGLGFAVPSEIVRKIAQQLIENGSFARGYLGIVMQELAHGQRDFFKMKAGEQGVIVVQVAKDGPAAKAGLQVRDVIVAIDGQKVSTPFELANAVGFNSPGTVVEVTYLRDGEQQQVRVELGTAPNLPSSKENKSASLWGLTLGEIESQPAQDGTTTRGILVLNSDNIKSDVRRGDVIVAVDNIEVQGLAWLESYLKDKQEVVLYLNRNGHYMFVTLQKK